MNRCTPQFEGIQANYILLKSLMNVEICTAGYLYPIKENGKNRQNDHASFDQINRVSNPNALAK